MVNISEETVEQIETRLRSVICRARIQVLEGAWSFFETQFDQPPTLTPETVAVVRDADSWSALRPNDDSDDASRERFGVLSFTPLPVKTTAGSWGGWRQSSSVAWALARSSSAAATAVEVAFTATGDALSNSSTTSSR